MRCNGLAAACVSAPRYTVAATWACLANAAGHRPRGMRGVSGRSQRALSATRLVALRAVARIDGQRAGRQSAARVLWLCVIISFNFVHALDRSFLFLARFAALFFRHASLALRFTDFA